MKIVAKKSLGQHFLSSRHVLNQIISAANISKDDYVLEIGPGTGILTEALIKTGAKLTAIEKDHASWQFLNDKFGNTVDFKLIEGDILEFDTFSSFQMPYSIVANIPYYITGAILEKFLENEPRPLKMILLVQKEVAERIIARNKKESILSISVKSFGVPRMIAKVPAGAFTPPPKVDSAILIIEDISDNQFKRNHIDIGHFFKIVRAGFAHKRKYAMRNLESAVERMKLAGIWKEIKLDTRIRPEDITVSEWLKIASLCK